MKAFFSTPVVVDRIDLVDGDAFLADKPDQQADRAGHRDAEIVGSIATALMHLHQWQDAGYHSPIDTISEVFPDER